MSGIRKERESWADLSSRASLVLVLFLSGGVLAWSAGAAGLTATAHKVAGPKAADPLRHVLLINGDRDPDLVSFDHQAHQQRQGGTQGCPDCHHVNRPDDRATSCYLCHTGMEQETAVFDHGAHQRQLGGNDSCAKCHDLLLPKSAQNAKACDSCHRENMGMTAATFGPLAPSYEDAMHGMCLNCHREKAQEPKHERLAECDTCHQQVHHEASEPTR